MTRRSAAGPGYGGGGVVGGSATSVPAACTTMVRGRGARHGDPGHVVVLPGILRNMRDCIYRCWGPRRVADAGCRASTLLHHINDTLCIVCILNVVYVDCWLCVYGCL